MQQRFNIQWALCKFYANIFENIGEIHRFLGNQNSKNQTEYEISNVNISDNLKILNPKSLISGITLKYISDISIHLQMCLQLSFTYYSQNQILFLNTSRNQNRGYL